MWLTEFELETFSNYRTPGKDKSISAKLLNPFWEYIVRWVPVSVAPNVLSLASLLCLVQAWYFSYVQGDNFPQATNSFAIVMIFFYWTLDAIDSKHALNTGNDSSLTEFFDHACSTVGCIFLVLIMCESYQVQSVYMLWYLVQLGQLFLFNKHLGAFQKEEVSYRFFNGPGEALSLMMLLLFIRGALGLAFVDHYVYKALDMTNSFLDKMDVGLDLSNEDPYVVASRAAYLGYYVLCVGRTLKLGKEHSSTRSGLLLCLMYRFVPAGLFLFDIPLSLLDVVAHGLMVSVLTSDMVVARMAGRELHPWIVIMTMVSFVSNFGVYLLALFYYGTTIFEVMAYTKLPLLTTNRNVYCDGIYDMCHIGHMKAFKNGLKFGTRLFVGVCSDEDATPYKRKPIMTTEERCEVVAACKYVYKVIPNAPCEKGSLNEEFIKKHNIHIVAHGEEYDNPEDEYYRVPREMGITRILPRTKGMSTSDLISRIQQRSEGGTKEVKAASD